MLAIPHPFAPKWQWVVNARDSAPFRAQGVLFGGADGGAVDDLIQIFR